MTERFHWGYPFDEPTLVIGCDAVAISAGGNLNLARMRDGTVLSWGSDLGGQLGVARSHVGLSVGDIEPPPLTAAATAHLTALAAVSVRLRARLGSQTHPGDTRLGGRPDLPEDMTWPVIDGAPAMFVGQVARADIAAAIRTMRADAGDATGLLSFLCDYAFRVGGASGEDVRCTVLSIPPGTVLVRRDFPDELDPDKRFVPVPLVCEAEMMDAPVEAWEVRALNLPHEQFAAWADRLRGEDEPRHRVFGYPEPVQNETRRWTDEMLLLQVDADDDAGMMWGDVGRLHFLIKAEDLNINRFDQVRLVFQCH